MIADIHDHICGKHLVPFRDCHCLDKLAKSIMPWRMVPLKKPCPGCGRGYTFDNSPSGSEYCTVACELANKKEA